MIERSTKQESEKAISVGSYASDELLEPDVLLDELDSLIVAAGGIPVGRSVQRRAGIGDQGVIPATYIGSGKAIPIGGSRVSFKSRCDRF